MASSLFRPRFRNDLGRPALLASAFVGLLLVSAAPARAECQEDVAKFVKQRDGVIAQLNRLTGGKKKALDPVAACPKFRSLTSILGSTVAYVKKNQSWCNFPDQLVQQVEEQRASFAKTAGQACGIAAKIGKMKAMQARQAKEMREGGQMAGAGPQRLPSGPL